MRLVRFVPLALLPLVLSAASRAAPPAAADPALRQAIASPLRTPAFAARDASRHPYDELSFFGLRPDATVVELWPARGYWTEILGPYLGAHGREVVALPPDTDPDEGKAAIALKVRMAHVPILFGRVAVATLGAGRIDLGPPASADFVLTFRNLHNWIGDGSAAAVLAACNRVLKPGGILGIEDHRASDTLPEDPKAENGYVRQSTAVAMASHAGFALVASSEIDANPRDTKNWPKGVWTLPPSFALGQVDRAKYTAIGEADNFVLKFRKVAEAAAP